MEGTPAHLPFTFVRFGRHACKSPGHAGKTICAIFRVEVWSCGQLLTVLIFLYVILCILSQYVQNYRPPHEQTKILLDQLQKHFLVISHVPRGGGGVLLLKLFA